jgi:hypothetical protein
VLTGDLAHTSTALLFTAIGGVFGAAEGVLKLTGSGHAAVLQRELSLLNACAEHEVRSVVRPVDAELIWFAIDGRLADQPAAAIGLPFLAGGDLAMLVARASIAGAVGAELALEVAEPLVNGLRDLLEGLPRPVAHADLRPQNVLLPSADAAVAQLTLIDLDAAPEIADAPLAPVADVHALGEILFLAATGRPAHGRDPRPSSGNPAFDALVQGCLASGAASGAGGYASVTDSAFVTDLAAARTIRRTAG